MSIKSNIGILTLIFFWLNAYSQESKIKLPMLNEHTFIPISLANPAFTNTYFSTYMGVGNTIDFRYPLFELPNGQYITLKGDVSFIDLNLKYQYQIQEWLSFYMRTKVAARVGTEVQTILSQGINTLTTFDLGWQFHLFKTKKLKMTGIFEMQSHNGNFINVWGFVQDIINQEPNPSLTNQIPLIVGATGLRMAYGINDLFGLRFDSKLSWGESFIRTETAFKYSFNTVFDVDFNKRFDVPIGLAASVMFTTQPDIVYVENKIGRLFIFKIAYTAATDFSVGLEYSIIKIPLNYASEVPMIVNFAFVAQYYF